MRVFPLTEAAQRRHVSAILEPGMFLFTDPATGDVQVYLTQDRVARMFGGSQAVKRLNNVAAAAAADAAPPLLLDLSVGAARRLLRRPHVRTDVLYRAYPLDWARAIFGVASSSSPSSAPAPP